MPGKRRLRSIRTYSTCFLSNSNSIHEPRYGTTLASSEVGVSRVNETPGERWSWETMTRSVPLMMKVPVSVISGSSPK